MNAMTLTPGAPWTPTELLEHRQHMVVIAWELGTADYLRLRAAKLLATGDRSILAAGIVNEAKENVQPCLTSK
ncbi:MAG: hypothetical protein HY678_02540 [Chloroflexi bacterium]|nr:hypothetical protein [Chloroflexota bacterium]